MLELATCRMAPHHQIVPFQPRHLDAIEIKGFELDYVEAIPNYREYVIFNAQLDNSFTGIVRGKVILIFGVRSIWPGVAELWMLPGAGIEKHTIAVVRGARAVLDNVIEHLDIMRLQLTVHCQNDTAYKFAKALYFEEEALLKHYGPEQADYYLMARFSNVRTVR